MTWESDQDQGTEIKDRSKYLWYLLRSTITRKFALARFFRNLALQIAAGVPIVRCVEQAALVSANPYI